MEKKVDNKLSNIPNNNNKNNDNIGIQNFNYYTKSSDTKNTIMESTQIKTSINNKKSNSYKNLSLLDRTNEMLKIKPNLGNKNEERKNIDNNNYKSFKSNLNPNNDNINYITNKNDGLNMNQLNYSKYQNNISETLYQNKNIMNNINSIIKNEVNEKNTNMNDNNNNTEIKSNIIKNDYKDNNKRKTFYDYYDSNIEKKIII